MVRLMKKSERFPKEWESFQRCGAGGYISIAEKFDEQLAEKGWYSQHLTKSLPVIEPETSSFNSNKYKTKTNYFHVEKQVEKPVEKIQSTELSDLIKEYKPTEWIVDSFGAKGACVLLAGDKGSGKTAFLYRLSEAISNGSVFMGELSTTPKKVLVWQADESRNNAHVKIKMMDLKGKIYFLFSDDLGGNKLDIKVLKNHIINEKIDVICIDSITGLLMGHGINIKDSEFCKPLYELNNLASELGVLIVISAHLTKEDRSEVNLNDILGAGTQGGAVSDIWGLWTDEHNDEIFFMKCLGKRNCEKGIVWKLDGNKEDYSFYLTGVGDGDLLPDKKNELSYKFLDHLMTNKNQLTYQDLAKEFRCNDEHARRICIRLYGEGKFMRKKYNVGNGRPYYKYWINSFPI